MKTVWILSRPAQGYDESDEVLGVYTSEIEADKGKKRVSDLISQRYDGSPYRPYSVDDLDIEKWELDSERIV